MNLATRRVVALLIDLAFFFMSFYLFATPTIKFLVSAIQRYIDPDFSMEGIAGGAMIAALGVFIVWPLTYFFLMGVLTKASPGKLIVGLKVYSESNQGISRWQAGLREVFRLMEIYSFAMAALSVYNIFRGLRSTTEMITHTHVLRKDVFEN
ncbi:RDD family protein [Cerasicoccus arenae]|uniref:RDD domain-containing protein n=1 Tax=Cerasicoccus arenae TaxID=424488 RepID=A0A8J3DAQ2_9BACT|nr:RDD family protein [Cerasicoccus arenae]MBK1858871.1 RDD family protein [Cerasicoccus arenae]GHB96174.1 hypothetical protein GCM10007047_09910 [Cerasicoccus arenae]